MCLFKKCFAVPAGRPDAPFATGCLVSLCSGQPREGALGGVCRCLPDLELCTWPREQVRARRAAGHHVRRQDRGHSRASLGQVRALGGDSGSRPAVGGPAMPSEQAEEEVVPGLDPNPLPCGCNAGTTFEDRTPLCRLTLTPGNSSGSSPLPRRTVWFVESSS